jgi:PAS domain S-box-containing protein
MRSVSGKLSLKIRFMVATGAVLSVLMTVIVLIVGRSFTRNIQEEVKARGLAVAHSIAAVSTNALLTYNYVALEQNAEQASRGPDLVYVIILDKEQTVAAFSGHSGWQGKHLNDPLNERALAATAPLVQSYTWPETGERVLDIAVPDYIPGVPVKWGTVRVGLSLERMYRQIWQTQATLMGIGALALLLGLAGAHFMAGRITRPLARVVDATVAAAGGALDQHLDIRTRDEVEELAKNFNVMIKEISDQRRQIEERLQEILQLKRYTDIVLASMTNGLMTLDLEGHLVSVNAATEAIFNVSKQALEGKSFLEIWPQDSPIVRILERCVTHGEPCRNKEVVLESVGGRRRTLVLNTSFLRDARDAPIGSLLVFNDVTEMKEMEARIRQADRLAALGTLSAGLAHEIRNPLSAIKTFVQLLPKKLSSAGFLDKFHVTVLRELNRINDLIESLLELARPPKMKYATVRPAELLRQVIDLYRDELEQANISLGIQEKGPLPEIRVDSEHLVRAFSNLVKNAKQAMPEGGTLTITAETKNEGVSLQFTDSGIGMDHLTLENIFNPFFTTKDRGTGLGLAITHKIVQEHGGTISVSSTPNVGSTFTLVLPRASS